MRVLLKRVVQAFAIAYLPSGTDVHLPSGGVSQFQVLGGVGAGGPIICFSKPPTSTTTFGSPERQKSSNAPGLASGSPSRSKSSSSGSGSMCTLLKSGDGGEHGRLHIGHHRRQLEAAGSRRDSSDAIY